MYGSQTKAKWMISTLLKICYSIIRAMTFCWLRGAGKISAPPVKLSFELVLITSPDYAAIPHE